MTGIIIISKKKKMSYISFQDTKKRASSHEPLASVRKALEAFLLNFIIVT